MRETFGYTGKSLDNIVGQYDYGYRHYDPLAGRFTTLDPIQDGDNWYAYCGNDGINLRDPFGLCSKENDGHKVFVAVPGCGSAIDGYCINPALSGDTWFNRNKAGVALSVVTGGVTTTEKEFLHSQKYQVAVYRRSSYYCHKMRC